MAISPHDLEIYWSSDDSTYTDISGSINAVNSPEAARMMSDVHKFGQDYPDVIVGPKESVDIPFEIVYTETGSDAFASLEPYFDSGSDIYLQWFPKGSGSGSNCKTQGALSSFVYPGGAANTADAIICSATQHADRVVYS